MKSCFDAFLGRRIRPIRRKVLIATLVAAMGVFSACSAPDDASTERLPPHPPPPPAPPVEFAGGEALFVVNCASCHGQFARGTTIGPPLAHVVYEPNHHADAAFVLAARNGVVQHHWNFGNMPPQPQVTDHQIAAIVGYVRWVQRQAGVY